MTPILATKLYMPPPRPHVVLRPRLIERLNAGLHRKLTLISAPAGFGKTTLVSAWLTNRTEGRGLRTESTVSSLTPQSSVLSTQVAWLSLDEGESDLARFLTYLVAALRTLAPTIGEKVVGALPSPQPPPTEALLTALLNDLTTLSEPFVLVLDDYHLLDAEPVDQALAFLLERLPPQMHLVIATRQDPHLPLARYRARGHLTELRAADLRFTPAEAAEFLTQVMGLTLSTEAIVALERRTEGWIAGLHLAALSLQGQPDPAGFIQSFTGSHQFVLDYLVEEVLQQQPERIQTFLLRTSILGRLCGSLCDAVLGLETSGLGFEEAGVRQAPNPKPQASQAYSQQILEQIERANLFLVPLDHERRWYRYHHLFAEVLRQRLHQRSAFSPGDEGKDVAELHIRASIWYEAQGLELEAFQHAAAANDVERAERLLEGRGMPRQFRGVVTGILNWLESLPTTVLDARPALLVRYASLLVVNGQTTGVEEKLQAAEAALQDAEADDQTRNLVGQIAAIRASLALTRYQVETMIAQSRRALEYLHPNNLAFRTTAHWTLGVAYNLQGDRAAARRAYIEAIALSQASGDIFTNLLATLGLGNIQEAANQLHLAAETYQRVLQLAGDPPQPVAGEAHLPLARICYEWNDLEAAEQHGRQSLQLARQFDRGIDRFILCEVLLARLKLARGDAAGAAALLAQASQSARQQNFVHRIPEVAAVQVLTFLRQGQRAAAAHLAETHKLPLSQARVHLAEGDPSAALAALEPWHRQVDANGWEDERLKVLVVEAVAHQAQGDQDQALQLLRDALALAEPGGFIRLFVDEGAPMAQIVSAAAANGLMPDYITKVLAAFKAEAQHEATSYRPPLAQSLIEPLSPRELEVLQLMAQGLSNREISERLFLALSTVKGHSRIIFDKLQVQRRTEAVARARELGLL